MKKNMFRIFTAAAITAGLSFSVPVCAGSEDAFAVFEAAAEKTGSLTSMEIQGSMDMNLAINGETTYLPVNLSVKTEGVTTEDLKMEMYVAMSVEDTDVDMTAYYSDGYYYLNTMGSRLKYPMDIQSMEDQLAGMNPQMNFEPDDFMELEMEETEDGTLLSFTISGDSVNQAADSVIGSIGGLLGEGMEFDLNSSDLSGGILVSEDGYISKTNMKIPIAVSVGGQELAMDMNLSMEYVNPGQDVTVELPDLSEYEELDMGALTESLV